MTFEKFFCIWWRDSCGVQQDWAPVEDVSPDETLCLSVGFKIAEDELHVVLAPHIGFGNGPHHCGTMTIPKACIVSEQEVEVLNKEFTG